MKSKFEGNSDEIQIQVPSATGGATATDGVSSPLAALATWSPATVASSGASCEHSSLEFSAAGIGLSDAVPLSS